VFFARFCCACAKSAKSRSLSVPSDFTVTQACRQSIAAQPWDSMSSACVPADVGGRLRSLRRPSITVKAWTHNTRLLSRDGVADGWRVDRGSQNPLARRRAMSSCFQVRSSGYAVACCPPCHELCAPRLTLHVLYKVSLKQERRSSGPGHRQ